MAYLTNSLTFLHTSPERQRGASFHFTLTFTVFALPPTPRRRAPPARRNGCTLLHRPLVHHVAGDALERHADVRIHRLPAGDFVHLEGEVPAEHVHGVGLRSVLAG